MTYALACEPYGPEHEALRNDPETGPVFPAIAASGVLALRRYESGELLAWGAFHYPDGCPVLVAAGKGPRPVIRVVEHLEEFARHSGIRAYAVHASTDKMKRIFGRLPGWQPVPGAESWFTRRLEEPALEHRQRHQVLHA